MDLLREYIRSSLLLELREIDLNSDDEDKYNVFSYKGWIVKYPYMDEIPWDQISQATGEDLSEIQKSYEAEGMATDFFIGSVDGNQLYVNKHGMFSHNPIASKLVKKVVSHLGIRHVTSDAPQDYDQDIEHYGDNESVETFARDVEGELPNILYHGTSSTALFGANGILKVGLVPGASVGKSNWKAQNIWHPDVVSLTIDQEQTYFHARNAAGQHGGFPVILAISIPDPDKITADYDVDTHTGQTTSEFEGVRNRSSFNQDQPNRYGRGPLKTSKDVGIIGYKGRIPAKFIDHILYFSRGMRDWIEASIEDLKRMQDNIDNYGLDEYEMEPDPVMIASNEAQEIISKYNIDVFDFEHDVEESRYGDPLFKYQIETNFELDFEDLHLPITFSDFSSKLLNSLPGNNDINLTMDEDGHAWIEISGETESSFDFEKLVSIIAKWDDNLDEFENEIAQEIINQLLDKTPD